MRTKKAIIYLELIAAWIIFSSASFAADWPTWMYDNSRSGTSPESVAPGSLQLQWTYINRFEPIPMKTIDKTDITKYWDGCYYPVAAKGKVLFGSSADGMVYCLDAKTGQEIWAYNTEGPVRFAPTIKDEYVLVGSDDGYMYCLNLNDGTVNWKYGNKSTRARRLVSNGRLTSAHAIRTGVVVNGDAVYFGCGIFPFVANMGARSIGLNIAEGSEMYNDKSMFYPKGYLRLNGNTIECPRNRFGYSSLASIKASSSKSNVITNANINTINVGGTIFKGMDGHVAGGTFSANVEGNAFGLSFSDGRLFVSTSKGYIYCFSSDNTIPVTVKPKKISLPYRSETVRQDYETAAKEILAGAGLGDVTKGYALIIDCEAGGLAIALAEASDLQIIGVETEDAKVTEANANINDAGLSNQISIQKVSSYDDLSYVSHMFNIISYDGYATNGSFSGSEEEARRLLRPYGGVAYLSDNPIKYGEVIGGGQWTHDRANPSNNPNSYDTYVTEDLEVQWHGDPGPERMVDRHQRAVAPLFINGILVVSGEDYFYGIDAYNGTILWEKSIDNTRRSSAYQNSSHFAAALDRVYIAQSDECLGLDPRTGNEVSRFTVPYDGWGWGYVGVVGDNLYGTAQKNPTAWKTWGTSGYIFALNRKTGAEIWKYDPGAAIVNMTICIGNDKVFFMAAGNSSTQNDSDPGFSMFNDGATDLVALDRNTGGEVWKKECDFSGYYRSCHMIYSKTHNMILAEGVTDGTVSFIIEGWDADDGTPAWDPLTLHTNVPFFSHWNHEAAPVVSGDSLFLLSFEYKVSMNVTTGQGRAVYWADEKGGHGCSNFSATDSNLFHRGWNAMAYNVSAGRNNRITTQNRSGCNINLIPAGGLLCSPEASSGCTCSFPAVESVTWRSTTPLQIDDSGTTATIPIHDHNGKTKKSKLQLLVFRGVNCISINIENTTPSKKLNIRIVNVAGKTLLNKSVTPQKKNFSYRWDHKKLSTGIYFISIKAAQEKCTKKLMIVK